MKKGKKAKKTSAAQQACAEYNVQFEIVGSLHVNFLDTEGLTERQVIQRAIELADPLFANNGSLKTEICDSESSYTASVDGLDRTSAVVLGETAFATPKLKIVKN